MDLAAFRAVISWRAGWLATRRRPFKWGDKGANSAAFLRYTGKRHIFQNLLEGTHDHYGSKAIRQAIVAGANITYKLLYNDAVAITGGQGR